MEGLNFNDQGEHVSPYCIPEQGPLRTSAITVAERQALPPPWAYLDHDELPYVTTADHRSTEGRIIPVGTRCFASRRDSLVRLRCVERGSGDVIVLDGQRWALHAPGIPVCQPSDAPELFLPA